jgi:hypothetical protein
MLKHRPQEPRQAAKAALDVVHALRPEGQFLGFDNSHDVPVNAQGIVGRATGCLKFFNGAGIVGEQRCLRRKK